MVLRDPTQLAAGMLMVGQGQLLLLSLMDGSRRRVEIQSAYARSVGQLLLSSDLDRMLDQLETAGFLDGPGFDAYYDGLARGYHAAPYRPLRDAEGFGAPAA